MSGTLAPAAPALEVVGLTIALPALADRAFAVEGADLSIGRGEILCLVGESGSGKSVLASALMGALPKGLRRTGGRISLLGEDLCARSEAEWRTLRGRRIALVPQEPMAALNPSTPVGRQIEEVFEIHAPRLPRAERRAAALSLLAEMRLEDPARLARAYPHQLSGGQCQRVCIAMALALKPDLLIADEPTTALDVTTQAEVLRLINELARRHGQAVLFVTHDLAVVSEIADRIAVMTTGRIVETGAAAALLARPSHPYTARLLASAPGLDPPTRPSRPVRPGGAGVSVKGLCKSYGAVRAVRGVDLETPAGSTLSIVGESGSGKSTLARVLAGLAAADAGAAEVGGVALERLARSRGPMERSRVQLVFQDPFGALNPRRAVGEVLARSARLAGASAAEAPREALAWLERVGLPNTAFDRRPSAFSGGQRQRIGIARALALRPKVLIADESVAALDVSVQAQILGLLGELQRDLGLTIVFITHDLRVAAAISDRIAVMRAGEIVEQGPAGAVLGAPSHPYTQALLASAPRLTRSAPPPVETASGEIHARRP